MEIDGYQKPLPVDAKKVFQGKIFSVWQWEQELYDGSYATFERIARPDYAFGVGVLEDSRIMLLYDEQPDREAVLTPAGGKVDEGETPEEALRREFLEETGFEIGEIREWFAYRPSTKMEMVTYGFIARSLKRAGEARPEPGERMREVTYSFEEFLALGQNPKLRDWMLRVKLLEAQVDSKKREALRKLLYE
ncbi:MAG: NUDIX domain-containing protein [Patescibacteria group bacterium]